MMKNVMARAWEIAREGVENFGGKVKEYFRIALKMAWAEATEIFGGSIATITAKEVEELMSMGASRWTKAGHDRLYINSAGAGILGLEVDRYKSGNICYATLGGEKISNSAAYRAINTYDRAYIDLSTGALKGVSGEYADIFKERMGKYLKKAA